MKHTPSIDSIEERLRRGRSEYMSLLGLDRQANAVPFTNWHLPNLVEGILSDRNRWSTARPGFLDVREWVEVHWATGRQTQLPAGTVPINDHVRQRDLQLDDVTATCKLVLAAVVHGAQTAAKYALEFSQHDLIEVHRIYVLSGASVTSARPLDDYCTLLPYEDALRKVKAQFMSFLPVAAHHQWPLEQTGNLCAIEARCFEPKGPVRHVSPLLLGGPLALESVLGLVWGKGLRRFGNWSGVPDPVAATLPFSHLPGGGSGTNQVLLSLLDYPEPSSDRPVNVQEAVELIGEYEALPERHKRALDLALRRLRDSSERLAFDEKVVDLCVALEALFMGDERRNQKTIISRRGSWYYADSRRERERIRALLKEFYDVRSAVVHGESPEDAAMGASYDQRSAQFAAVDDVVRASLKTMISEGMPQDWDKSKDPAAVRQDPPRAEADIPSMKADSLSWTVAAQKEIDAALMAAWRRTIDSAPALPPDVEPNHHGGAWSGQLGQIEQFKREGIASFVARTPALLYMAHPMWPRQEGDSLDDRTRYYCKRDVERHLQEWREAAHEKRLHQFEPPHEEPPNYIPENVKEWRDILVQWGYL